jgi:exopolysaccharide biosynthesis protein
VKVKGMPFIKRASQIVLRSFLLSLILISCSSIYSDTWQDSFVSFPAVETVIPSWQPFADGIKYFHGKAAQPQFEFWTLRIDLGASGTRIVTGAGAENQNGNLSMRVSSFVRNGSLLAGINAVPFDIVSSTEGQPVKNMGIVVSEGKLLSGVNPYYDAVIFYKDGTAAICRQAEIHSVEAIENAVGGFYQILAEGQPSPRTNNNNERHPRSAAGISSDGKILYLLVIDGRRADSAGATEKETAQLLFNLGSWAGINFDGGGSSALAMRLPDGNVKPVNMPVHGGIPGRERAVAGCIGVTILKTN